MQVEAKRKCVLQESGLFCLGSLEHRLAVNSQWNVCCLVISRHLYRQNKDCVGAVCVAVEGMQRRWSVGSKNTEP